MGMVGTFNQINQKLVSRLDASRKTNVLGECCITLPILTASELMMTMLMQRHIGNRSKEL